MSVQVQGYARLEAGETDEVRGITTGSSSVGSTTSSADKGKCSVMLGLLQLNSCNEPANTNGTARQCQMM